MQTSCTRFHSHHECPFTTTSVTALHCALLASSFSMTTCDAARWQRWAVGVMSMMPCFRNAVDDGPEDLVWARLHIMNQQFGRVHTGLYQKFPLQCLLDVQKFLLQCFLDVWTSRSRRITKYQNFSNYWQITIWSSWYVCNHSSWRISGNTQAAHLLMGLALVQGSSSQGHPSETLVVFLSQKNLCQSCGEKVAFAIGHPIWSSCVIPPFWAIVETCEVCWVEQFLSKSHIQAATNSSNLVEMLAVLRLAM